jgi:hypothetical protein
MADMEINNTGQDKSGRHFTRPTSHFKTRSKHSRTFTMVMTSPDVRLFDDGTHWLENASTMFKTEPMPIGHEHRSAWFMPATFQVYGLSTPDGGALPMSFTIDRVVSVWESGPARLLVDVVDVHIGALHDESIWAKAETVMKYPRPAAPWRISPATLRAIPIDTFVDEAMKLAQVTVEVVPLIVPVKKDLWVYRLRDGSSVALNAYPVSYTPTEERKTRDLRGKRSRGPTNDKTGALSVKDPAVLAVAAKCYDEGMSKDETAVYIEQELRQYFAPNSIGTMWTEATKKGLMTRNRKATK